MNVFQIAQRDIKFAGCLRNVTLHSMACFMLLLSSQVAYAQKTASAPELTDALLQESPNYRRWDLARELAFRFFEENKYDAEAELALEIYVRNAARTGNAFEALPYSEELCKRTGSWVHQSKHVELLVRAGQLNDTKSWLDEILNNQSEWQNQQNEVRRNIDYAMEREYWFAFDFDPQRIEDQELLAPYHHIPIPKTNTPWQEGWYELSGDEDYNVHISDTRSEYLEVLPYGQKHFYLDSRITLKPVDVQSECQQATWGGFLDEFEYIQPSTTIDYMQADVSDLADSLSRPTSFGTVQAICEYCSRNILYNPNGQPGGGKASDVLARKHGHCEGASTLVVALLRKNMIPARLVRGHSSVLGDSSQSGFSKNHHTIVEFYLDSVGWVQWDFNETPGVVVPRFLALWSYRHFQGGGEEFDDTYFLHRIQRLGVGANPYNYASFNIIRRRIPK